MTKPRHPRTSSTSRRPRGLARIALATALLGSAALAACHVSTKPNVGMVSGATAFPVAVTDLDTTAAFAWAGDQPAKRLYVTTALAHETADSLAARPVVWDVSAPGGFASPVRLNTVPPGATSGTGAFAGLIGGKYYVVYVERMDGSRGSYKFQAPMPTSVASSSAACTPTSTPAGHYGHCVSPYADKGSLCSEFTGSAGATNGQATCDVLKGTYAEGPCPPTPAGQCLARCGAPNESLDTADFASAAEWQAACAARKGTYLPPAAP
ncbi:MAG: hypothetical protein JNK64_01485 [Myxococcales bacterium]|nr:hypothetical protein [Myxococcales bacterium]